MAGSSAGSNPEAAASGALTIALTAVVATAGINLLYFAMPLYLLQLFERVLFTANRDTLIFLTLLALLAVITLGMLERQRTALMIGVSAWYAEIGHAIASAPSPSQAKPRQRQSSRLEARLDDDITLLRRFFASRHPAALLDVPFAILFIGALWLLHPVLGALALLACALLSVITMASERLQSRRMAEERPSSVAHPSRLDRERLSPQFANRLSARAADRAFANSKLERSWLQRAARRLGQVKTLRAAFQILILGTAAGYAMTGALSPGTMVVAGIFAARAITPFEAAIDGWKDGLAAHDAHKRVGAVFTRREAEGVSARLPSGSEQHQSIRLSRVHVPGRQGGRPRLQIGDLSVARGRLTVIIGAHGSGKSTLCGLLSGAIEPQAGKIEGRGQHIGYLPDTLPPVEASIAETVSGLDPSASATAMVDLLRALGADTLVSRMEWPEQDQVEGLSFGEQRLLWLAAAFHGSPGLIVLDQPDIGLTEDKLRAVSQLILKAVAAGSAVVVATQDTRFIAAAQDLIHLAEGRIEAAGPRQSGATVTPLQVGSDARRPADEGTGGVSS